MDGIRAGCEKRIVFNPAPMAEVRRYLDQASEQWDQAPRRLQSFVEE